MNHTKLFAILSIFVFTLSLAGLYADSTADARARSGGRSFGGSRTFRPAPVRQPTRSRSFDSRRSSSGGFLRGLAGGVMGGFLGSMLFGSLAHAGGGIGGTGIGLFQILIIGGIGYFLYKKFMAPKRRGQDEQGSYSVGQGPSASDQSYSAGPIDAPPPGGGTIYEQGNAPLAIDEEEIKEIAQDIFFRVQAAWMRRDIESIRDILGPELLAQYQADFQEMKSKGIVNRLENIAVRSVEIIESGRESGYEYVKVRFTANLLDYTVEEATGRVIEGSDREPVKFQEVWTLARPEGTGQWKLFAVEH